MYVLLSTLFVSILVQMMLNQNHHERHPQIEVGVRLPSLGKAWLHYPCWGHSGGVHRWALPIGIPCFPSVWWTCFLPSAGGFLWVCLGEEVGSHKACSGGEQLNLLPDTESPGSRDNSENMRSQQIGCPTANRVSPVFSCSTSHFTKCSVLTS